MSTWVRPVESDEPGDDEPKEVWFNSPQNSKKRKRGRTGKGASKATIPEMPVFSEPVGLTDYPGDPTEQEVIDNVRNLPDERSGGKVRNYLPTCNGMEDNHRDCDITVTE